MNKIHTLSSILVAAILLTGCGAAKDTTMSSGTEVVTTSSTTTTTETTTTIRTTVTTTTTASTTTATSTTTTEPVATTALITEPPKPEPEPEPEPEQETEPIVDTSAEPEEDIGTAFAVTGYSESDAVLLAMLIHHESSATWDGKIAVGNCVLNRMNNWGLSLSGVIYQPYQFSVASYMYTYDNIDYQVACQLLSSGSTDTRIMYFDGNHGGVNWFYDSYHNYLYAA